ncbi:MAG: MaoC family dehydratase N-terminal domain-containing protein [Clostridia bacterium]|nr:MaoC family dehydratase N-terminal domain-containing protein [Clostridia bacterium]
MFLDDLYIGMEIDIPAAVIEKEKMMDFARLYDPIPLHCDEEYAKTTKFGQLIAPGVMSFMAVWAKFLEKDIFGDELVAGKSTKIEWFKPVFAEDVLKGQGRVTAINRRNPYNGIAEVTIDAVNQRGETVLSSVTEAIVRYRCV